MTPTTIEIDRLPLTFLTAASPERVELVWRAARDAIEATLPVELAAACGPQLDADDAYVFIDRLEVGCAVRSDWAAAAVASTFATQLVRQLGRERSQGQARVYRDRTEYLSAFLVATVDGMAFTRWWFAEFDGLAPLGTSACIRTVVTNEGSNGWDALAGLTPDLLHRVVSTLDDGDADRLLDGLGLGPIGADAAAVVAALRPALAAPLRSRSHRIAVALAGLVRSGGRATRRSASALLGLAAIADAARTGRLSASIDAASSASVSAWCEGAGVDDTARAALLSLDSTVLEAFVAEHAGARIDGGDGEREAAAAFDLTTFGGALLLAAVLTRLGWWSEWRDRLARDGAVAERADELAASLALAVVARAVDPARPATIERDPVVRRAFGLTGPPGARRHVAATNRSLREALVASVGDGETTSATSSARSLVGVHARILLAEFGRRVPGCEGSSPAYLRTRLLSLPAAVASDGSAARLGHAPLDVLLGLSGLKRATVAFPDGRRLVLSGDLFA